MEAEETLGGAPSLFKPLPKDAEIQTNTGQVCACWAGAVEERSWRDKKQSPDASETMSQHAQSNLEAEPPSSERSWEGSFEEKQGQREVCVLGSLRDTESQ